MGYTTTFDGILKFKNEVTTSALGKLKTILGEDAREHGEWGATHLSYIDFEVSEDFSGLQWDGSEKSYDMVDKLNLVIKLMREDHPNFALEGQLLASGEDPSDVWHLVVNDAGTEAYMKEVVFASPKIRCPHCDEVFHIEQAEEQ